MYGMCRDCLILLDLIAVIIFGKEYKLQHSSLCTFLHPVSLSVLGSDVVLRTAFSDILDPRPFLWFRVLA